jgi:hypothetical protein
MRPLPSLALACGLLALVSTASPAPLLAQDAAPATVERKARGLPGKDIQVGVYVNVQPDCTSGNLPTLRLVRPPENGQVTIKQGKLSATNYKQCLALQVPGYVAFYRSKPDFVGDDSMIIEVKFPAGRTELQQITVTIDGGPGGRKI